MVLMPRSGSAERVRGHAAARQIEGAKAAGLRQARGVGVDGADHLQRAFVRDRSTQQRSRSGRIWHAFHLEFDATATAAAYDYTRRPL